MICYVFLDSGVMTTFKGLLCSFHNVKQMRMRKKYQKGLPHGRHNDCIL